MQLYKRLLFLFTILLCSLSARAQFELPFPNPVIFETIPAGSLIIPMDTTSQRLPGYFNLKAYGLVNYLLQNEIPVKWAINMSKTKISSGFSGGFPDIDSTFCNRVFPDTTALTKRPFRSGPFIIENSWVAVALPFIYAYEAANGNNIAVFKLSADVSSEIRYTLTFKPRIYLVNHQGYDTITVAFLNEAGYGSSSYTLSTPINQVFDENGKYSLVSDAHYNGGDTTHINPILRYLNRGGNVLAECDAQGAYENAGLTLTTAGIDTVSGGSITSPVYSNFKLPIGQFDGPLITPNGGYKYWKLKTGSSFRSTSYQLFRYTTTGLSPNVQVYVLAGGKVKPVNEKGGCIYYLSGHDYYFTGSGNSNDNNKINGRRIWLNATLIPPADTMDLDFTTDIDISLLTYGFAVKNEIMQLDVIAKNLKGGTAKNVQVQLNLPAGISYNNHTCGIGSYNSGTGVWTIGSLAKGTYDTLHLSVEINQLGLMSISALGTNTAYEKILPNNSATLNLTGVSRPVAVNDTSVFLGPYAVDVNTYTNDSDEDGGPFGNTSIYSGPFHGTATIIGNDTVRYVPFASYTGPDSMLYVTCDNYPLCDTAWLYINVVNPLPVELSHFSGQRSQGKVTLNWITSSEKENDFFAIERSIDGKYFEDRGHVKGSGNSVIERQYKFAEKDNGVSVIYYRLNQFDWNGDHHYSKTIALPINKNSGLTLTMYPNPVTAGSDLIVRSENFEGDAVLSITDITGRSIFKKELSVDSSGIFEVVSGKLNAGCYVVALVSEYETISTKLIVK